VILHGKKGLSKKIEKGDIVTRFWYTLKNLDPFVISTMVVKKATKRLVPICIGTW
jgi:hypothetical protein